MRKWIQQQTARRKTRFIPLRTRFIASASLLLIFLVGAIAVIVGVYQGRVIREAVERQGLAMAQGLAATSKAALATYNYIALEQAVNQVVKDQDAVYVIIHDKEGRVAGYSGRPDLQGSFLQDEVSAKATTGIHKPLIQQTQWGPDRMPVLDIAVPVFITGSDYPWGTVRVALSLQTMYQQIRQIQLIIAGVGLVAVLIGVFLSTLAARRITRPLGALVKVTMEAAQGNLNQHIDIKTRDEVEVLANNFSKMIQEILAQRDQLELQLTEIKRLQRYTEKLLTTMGDGLLSVNRHRKVAAINPAACRMFGFTEQVREGYSIDRLFSGIPAVLSYLDEMFQNPGGRPQQELHINGPEGKKVILAGSSLLTDDQGRNQELIVNFHDITELKQLESRVRQAERLAALGTLAAGMAHEIRNPLSAIKTFVQLLPRKVERPGFMEKFQRTVPRELERINRLIEDLLQLAREPKYQFRSVEIRSLLEQCIELFEQEMNNLRITWHLETALAVPYGVWADPDQLARAFNNLLQNAIQAMQDGGDLTIETTWQKNISFETLMPSNQQGWMKIVFRDTGIGISSEDMKNIFNPFFTTKDTGTGLGLAITHKVITEHDGRIEVNSKQGSGTCFTIYLPAIRFQT